jgi:RND superfamily putative drug exporter
MVLVSVLLLPALLGLVGHRIDALSLPGIRPKAERDSTRESMGTGWSRFVTRRPAWSGGLAIVVLVALALPILSLRLGNLDDGTEPTSSTVRRSYDLLSEGFGPGFSGPLTIAVDLEGSSPRALDRLSRAIAADPGVAGVAPAVVNPGGDAAVIAAVPDSAPQAEATAELVHRLRRDVVTPVLASTGGRAYVSGSTAVFIDLSDKVTASLPWFIGAVLLLSFLLLVVVFRSILVPLKAVVMNLLAIGAAYGVIVAVFQWGWLKDVVGLEETLPIVSFLPMMMFAILFGLSMDYEVFILSRVREEWLRTGDSRASVIDGIAATARVITSAAIIMISVFGAFVLGDDPLIKMFGFGLAVAVFIDATIVRMVLVPATMTLLGDANWWLPEWLDRVLPALDVEGEAGLPPPEYESGSASRDAPVSREAELVT